MAEQAIQDLILARGTHFDSLMKRLKEPRVRRVIEPLILGEEAPSRLTEDYLYTRDLGLIREIGCDIKPANPIYAEMIVRALNSEIHDSIKRKLKNYEIPRYMKDGRIDVDFLIKDFQAYWRENSEIWIDRYETKLYEYTEAAPHLVMQAFLQRVVNGDGQIIREMAIGTKRADLCLVYDGRKYPIELKIMRNAKSLSDGMTQTAEYADKVGSNAGWLIIFDRDTNKSWDEKIYMKKENVNGKEITVAGC
jgi:hypothetical protein